MQKSWLFRVLVVLFTLLASWETTASSRAGTGKGESIARVVTESPPPLNVIPNTHQPRPLRTQSLVYRHSLPMISNVSAPVTPPSIISDDFSNPSTGWPVGDDGNVMRGYNNGEYQILIRQSDSIYVATPGVSATNMQIDVDVRFVGSGTGAAGIAFDISDDISGYYVLYLVPASQQTGSFKLANGRWEGLSGWDYWPAMKSGTATNHLTVIRNGTTISWYVNGSGIVSVTDSTLSSGRIGLTAETFPSSSNADIRFDNFVVSEIIPPTPTPLPATPRPTPTAIASQASEAVSYQVNPAHNGMLSDSTFTLPLAQRWSVNLGGLVSFPLIAHGKVFVTVANTSEYGNQLYALDAATGGVVWGPIPIPGTYWSATAAYDGGNLFVINENGLLRSFDAETGSFRWSQQMSYPVAYGPPPVAAQGVVYVGGGGYLEAVDELFGQVLWSIPVNSYNTPTLSDDGIYATGSCHYVFKFARTTGAKLWGTADPSCVGGGGTISPYYAGRLYNYGYNGQNSNPGAIFDAANGVTVGSFTSRLLPAFVGNTGFYLNFTSLLATDLTTGVVLWSFVGDGGLTTSPIVVNNQVYMGSSSGSLYALDTSTGQVVWSTNVGAAIPYPLATSGPLAGLNAGDGLLVVPAGSLLVAYAGPNSRSTAGLQRVTTVPNDLSGQ